LVETDETGDEDDRNDDRSQVEVAVAAAQTVGHEDQDRACPQQQGKRSDQLLQQKNAPVCPCLLCQLVRAIAFQSGHCLFGGEAGL